ncbi:MAG: alpha/beta hydrolase [Novosphingobium aromaticivorans]|nr:alpha/beta hydrolase [Novosphingobium aromaticivorans]
MMSGAIAALSGEAAAKPVMPPPPDLVANPPARNDPRAVHFARGVTRLSEVPYKVVPGYRALRLDLYLPTRKAARAPLPLVLWIHGGAFELGDPRNEFAWKDWPAQLAKLASRGFAVAAVSYRFSAEAKFPAQTEDIRSALAFLVANKQRWGIDPNRTFVWGSSAGAHLALMTGLQADSTRDPYRIRGIVDWFGPSDLAKDYVASSDTPVTRLLGCSGAVCSDAALKAASPASYVTSGAPDLLILHGIEDSIVPLAQSEALVERYRSAGASVRLETLPDVEHAFAGASPEQLAKVLAQSFAFFEAHSRK